MRVDRASARGRRDGKWRKAHLASTAKTFALVKLSTPNTLPRASVKNPIDRKTKPKPNSHQPHIPSLPYQAEGGVSTHTAHPGQDGRTPHTRQPQTSIHRPIRGEPDDTESRCQPSRLEGGQSIFPQSLRGRDRLKLDILGIIVFVFVFRIIVRIAV